MINGMDTRDIEWLTDTLTAMSGGHISMEEADCSHGCQPGCGRGRPWQHLQGSLFPEFLV